MRLTKLDITYFRNLEQVSLQPHPKFNLIYGANGAGKTSILEAIYYLGMGRSFRSSLPSNLIQHDKAKFSIVAKQTNDVSETAENIIGIERQQNGNSTIKINSEQQKNRDNLIQTIPLQLIDVAGHRVVEAGPGARREFIDWGLFHVEQEFLLCWRRVRKSLRQRNALLKNKDRNIKAQLAPWNKDLATHGLQLHQLRETYMQKLTPIAENILSDLLETNITISYYPGWNPKENLLHELEKRTNADIALGYTGIGPQKADVRFKSEKGSAQETLSRGQQKLLVCALQLAQGKLVKELSNKDCIYLIDDLPSELDSKGRKKVLTELANNSSQVFITSIANLQKNERKVMENNLRVFHVKHGAI